MHLMQRLSAIVNDYLTVRVMMHRAPDKMIGPVGDRYLIRWYLIPRNRVFNVYLHLFWRSDDDRAHHDHPWLLNFSWLLDGQYIEEMIARGGIRHRIPRRVGAFKLRLGASPHRLELVDGQPCTTLFITGPMFRRWGFHCRDAGWVDFEAFTKNDGEEVGKGCDQ